MSFTIPMLLIIAPEEVVDFVEVVHHMQRCDHLIPGYFSYQNRLGDRVCESLL